MSSGLRNEHTEMPHSLVLHQSYCCKVKYSEKQISFSHGNLYVLHLLSTFLPVKTWLSAQNRIFSSTSIDTTLMGQVLPNRKSLDFDYLKLRQMLCYCISTSKILKWTQGFWRRQPRLVTDTMEISLLRSLVALQQLLVLLRISLRIHWIKV